MPSTSWHAKRIVHDAQKRTGRAVSSRATADGAAMLGRVLDLLAPESGIDGMVHRRLREVATYLARGATRQAPRAR